MDRSNVINLIAKTYTKDAIGQYVEEQTERSVFCNISSVSRSEWQTAGQMGFKPELVATMFAPEYHGEELAVIGGMSYGVYRTYLRDDELLELYLEKKVGENGNNKAC